MVHAYSDCTVKSAFKTQYPDLLLSVIKTQNPTLAKMLYILIPGYNCAANLD